MAWIRLALPAVLMALLASFFACDDGGTDTQATSTGTGQGGCPLAGPPEPLFTLTIRAMDGPVPSDTKLSVDWSGAQEPEIFILDDPSTHLTLAEGNVVCVAELDAGVPEPMDALVCELWTVGTTEIQVEAMGYVTHTETLTPETLKDCDDRPVPSEIDVELMIDLDAGQL